MRNNADLVKVYPIHHLMQGGTPLPRQLASYLESIFAADLSTVRIHVDPIANELGTEAFAVGEHIYFSPSYYQPGTVRGLAMLGHEIAHVLQQRAGRLPPSKLGEFVDDENLEDEANEAGFRVVCGLPVRLEKVSEPPTPAIQAIKLSIGGIQANQLLYVIDKAVENVRNAHMEAPSMPPAAKGGGFQANVWKMDHGKNWLYMAGLLAITGENRGECRVPCTLLVGHDSEKKSVVVGDDSGIGRVWAERVYFGNQLKLKAKADLNYKQVSEQFASLFPGIEDYRIAQDILLRMMGRPTQQGYKDNRAQFIADIAALMFGVEASRFSSCLATSLMLLDLIVYGKGYGRSGEKKFTLKRAFHSTDWDNNQWYGGKYPYAVHGTGTGNMRMRNEMATQNANPYAEQHIRQLTQRHAVPRRETTLFIHWLEAHHSDLEIANLTLISAQRKLEERLLLAYRDQELPAPFPYSPRADTGEHAYALGARPTDTKSVFWADGNFYHIDFKCKTLPGRYQNADTYVQEFTPDNKVFAAQKRVGYDKLYDNQKRKIDAYNKASDVVEKTESSKARGTILQAEKAGKKACPICVLQRHRL